MAWNQLSNSWPASQPRRYLIITVALRLRRTLGCLAINAHDVEGPIVRQRRNFASDIVDTMGINVGGHDAGLRAALGERFAPRRKDQAVAKGFAAVFVSSALRGRKNERLRLDGARPEQRMPVRFARDAGEGG